MTPLTIRLDISPVVTEHFIATITDVNVSRKSTQMYVTDGRVEAQHGPNEAFLLLGQMISG